MARKSQSAAIEALDELQSSADHLADWIRDNMTLVIGGVAGLLLLGGLVSFVGNLGQEEELEASTALYEAQTEYMLAMGASPTALVVPDLANPAAAEGIRAEYATALAKVADEYDGTAAGFVSQLEEGLLAQEAGDTERALEIYTALADQRGAAEGLRGLALQRAGQALEELGRFEEAAARHRDAAALASYPLRHWALADAARNLAAAGDSAGAVALYDRLETEAPSLRLPDAERALARELRALSRG